SGIILYSDIASFSKEPIRATACSCQHRPAHKSVRLDYKARLRRLFTSMLASEGRLCMRSPVALAAGRSLLSSKQEEDDMLRRDRRIGMWLAFGALALLSVIGLTASGTFAALPVGLSANQT